jgi:Bacterial PH domain
MANVKTCIWCGEEIKAAAKICRFCNRSQVAGEETLFEGSPSILSNLGLFVADFLLCFLVIGLFKLPYDYLRLKSMRYRITTRRIVIERGILSRRVDNTELYRVKDHAYHRTIGDFFTGCGTISLESSDVTDPHLRLRGLPNSRALYGKLVAAIESCREEAGVKVREME